MKKLLSCILLLTLVFVFAGCARLGDLSDTDKILIAKYTEAGEMAETVTVTETEIIQHICDNFSSLWLKKEDPSEGAAKTYELTFYTNGEAIQTVFFTSNAWLAFDGYTHAPVRGELDLAYIEGLFPCPFRWSSTESGHSKIMLCDCCDAPAVEYPHENRDADMFCDICGYEIPLIDPPTNYFLRNQAGCQWLNEISAEDIAELKIISEAVGVAPGTPKNISTSTNEAVIARIFEEYYWLDTWPVSKENGEIDGGGAVTVKFILKDGTVKELYINNGNYRDTNGNYFALSYIPNFTENDNTTKAYGFITYTGTGTIYDIEKNFICGFPVDELEFVITGLGFDLFANGYDYCIDTEFGKLYIVEIEIIANDFVSPDYYFMCEHDREFCYRLVGKRLDEIIKEYCPYPE